MSKISTAYDYFLTELNTLLPSKSKIPNPYSLPDNNIQFLQDGYGFKTEGHFLNTQQLNFLVQEYAFKVVLCREVVKLDSDTEKLDEGVKALEEDTFTVRKHFYDIDCNGIPDDIDLLTLGSSDPIGFFLAGNSSYIFTETNILVRIREQYSTC